MCSFGPGKEGIGMKDEERSRECWVIVGVFESVTVQ